MTKVITAYFLGCIKNMQKKQVEYKFFYLFYITIGSLVNIDFRALYKLILVLDFFICIF